MRMLRTTLGLVLSTTLVATALLSRAAAQTPRPARVEFELSTESDGSPTATQQWYKTLTELKVDSLRMRSRGLNDKPEIQTAGTREVPTYKIVGMINRSGDLVLPGGRFSASDKTRLNDWITKLRNEGPARASGGARLPYGLTKEQFGEVYEDLSRPIPFTTLGRKPLDFTHQAADVVAFPLEGSGAIEVLLQKAEPLDVELRGMSAGTAMAFVFRRADLALVPQLGAGRRPSYKIVPIAPKQEQWPVGWPPKAVKPELVPGLFEQVDVELKDVEVQRVLTAVAEHISVPMLIDRAQLAREKIDLNAIKANMLEKRSMYESVLRSVLVPKKLVHDVRVDETNRPFLWITTARAATAEEPSAKEAPR